MKKIILLIIFVFIAFYFFSSEKVTSISDDSSFADNNSFTFNTQGLFQNSKDLSNYTDVYGFILEKTAANKSSKTTYKFLPRFNLMIGIGFMISGQLLFWVLGAPVLAAGIVLMNYTEYHTYGVRGWYVDAPYYNQGLALTIVGGVCILSGIIFIIVSGVNFGIYAKRNQKSKKASLENFSLLLDYNMKSEEFILGVDFKL